MKRFVAMLGFLGLSACGSQTDSDYLGETQGVLKGRITVEPGLEVSEGMDVFLMWYSTRLEAFDDGPGDSLVEYETNRISIRPEFPTSYELDLIEPPNERAQLVAGSYDTRHEVKLPDEVNIGFANIAVAPKSWLDALDAAGGRLPKEGNGGLPEPSAIGGSEDFVVVYVDGDVLPNTMSEFILGAPLKKGYHLMRVVPEDETEIPCATAVREACRDILRGLTTDSDPEEIFAAQREHLQCTYDGARSASCFAGAKTHKWTFEPVERGFDTPVPLKIVPVGQYIAFPLST